MQTLSWDLRARIVAAYAQAEGTRADVARRFRVSLGLVKKLLQQRRRIGELGAQQHRSGRKPGPVAAARHQLRALLDRRPELTLAELRAATGRHCTLPAIQYGLKQPGLTYKKRRARPARRPGLTARVPGGRGGGGSPALIRPGGSSATSRGPKRT